MYTRAAANARPLIPIVSPDDQKVRFVELFFDLVFWLVWWSWTQYTWALNAANTDRPRIPLQRRAVRIFGGFSVIGLLAVLTGAVLGGNALYLWWSAAIFADLTAAGIGAQAEGWNLHPDHFVERHGLIVIIAFGATPWVAMLLILSMLVVIGVAEYTAGSTPGM